RAELWRTCKVVVSTPQGLENDVVSRRVDLSQVSLLVVDEAHRAVGEYAYAFVARKYRDVALHERILALTASPGDRAESIQEVCRNLGVERVEVRSVEDADVLPYVQELEVRLVRVELPERYGRLRGFLRECYLSKLEVLKELGFLSVPPSSVGKVKVLELSRALFARMAKGERTPEMLRAVSLAAEALKVEHAVELIETQGVYSTLGYLQGLVEQAASSKTKAVQNLVRDAAFRSALALAQSLVEEGVVDPKMVALERLVAARLGEGAKAIVFTQYREQAKKVSQMLVARGISNEVFVGQAKRKDAGLSQKQQQEVLSRFREGGFRCLVATSVAEEGLDIPEVDVVVFFEPVPSAIRSVQRRGRTGRHAKGLVFVLVTKGTRDEAYHFATKSKERRMHRVLGDLKKVVEPVAREPKLEEFAGLEHDVVVHVDQRERGSGVVRALSDLGVRIELMNLEIGDYVLSDRVVVELKRVPDFVDSLVDGRLLDQARQLRRYARPVLILEGDEDVYGQRNVHPNAIRGVLASLIVDFGITVLRSRSPGDTAGLLAVMARREQVASERELRMHGVKPLSLDQVQEYVVSSLPGIGPRLAVPLLRRFGSIRALVNASEEELREVDLIGPSKAKKLRDLFDAHFERS
ncbi:MAG: DEAD/DEAH box helicase, partial [Nitrosarchaeum sp.]|nr:DEAD/DEAH box helicase [Nitrosarchaeum sp.]